MNITELIGSLGFPIAVCAWLLIKEDKVMKELTASIKSLEKLIESKLV